MKISVQSSSPLGQERDLETGSWQPDVQWLLLVFHLMPILRQQEQPI